jgi:hypothetical protein
MIHQNILKGVNTMRNRALFYAWLEKELKKKVKGNVSIKDRYPIEARIIVQIKFDSGFGTSHDITEMFYRGMTDVYILHDILERSNDLVHNHHFRY